MKKNILIPIIVSLLIPAGIIIAAWSQPTATPPDGNTNPPLHTGGSQIKQGGLQVGGKLKSTDSFVLPSGARNLENGSMWLE